ncbi:hypothetical protein [Pseudoalteromonas sp. T1lg22]|uniref:hypothetical protein n=1 Tax=Pseudoalteromonas sp. T1lg22 TaxID=2077096 RepID=UPI000CF6E0EB|nr:hypothetical protein [Pseudoalteromonas sp. T1lg22]
MNTYTIHSVCAETYCLKTGQLINSVHTKTITKLKNLLKEIGIEFDQHGNNGSYLKILNLMNKGLSMNQAIYQVLGGTND